jgi:hypothetical protein
MAPAPVRYTYCWDDYVALDKALRRESFLKRYQLLIVPVFLTLCIVGVMAGLQAYQGRDVGRSLSVLLTFGWFWLIPFAIVPVILIANRIERGIWYKRQRIDGKDVDVVFDDPKGLSLATKDGAGVIAWSAIRKIATDGGMHVVFQDNRLVGVCLPRRAFASDAAFDEARAFIEARIIEHRGVA